MMTTVLKFSTYLRYRIPLLCLLLILTMLCMPVGAEVFSIDPDNPPPDRLSPEEAQKLRSLLDVKRSWLMSKLSPNGKYVLAHLPEGGMAFLNIRNGRKVAVNDGLSQFKEVAGYRWPNNRTLTYLAHGQEMGLHQIRIDRRSGEWTADALDLPGTPISLSNGGDKVVLARRIETPDETPEESTDPAPDRRLKAEKAPSSAPIKRVDLVRGFGPGNNENPEFENRYSVPVATTAVECFIYDLTTGKELHLGSVPMDTALVDIKWSPHDYQLAIVQWLQLGTGPSDDVENHPAVQDALGNLPPSDNPYFTSNALHLFSIEADSVQHRTIHPEVESGSVFMGVNWDPCGLIFTAHMWTASTLEGRTYPIYANPNGSKYRFYVFNGHLIDEIDRPELEAKFGQPHMVSPYEVLFHTPYKMDYGVFSYNLYTKKLTRVAIPAGTVHQLRAAPFRKQIIYQFSSYQQPYELYHLNLRRKNPIQLTHFNDTVRQLNQVRADPVAFKLAKGEQRTGYLIQPANGVFPPKDIPTVVWQSGGPITAVTQRWGGRVEGPFNLLPNFGFAVLVVPLPGRDGFGRDFLEGLSDGNNFGQIDIQEQAEIIDQLTASGYTSWDKTGVTGCSYGGYFASQSITSPGIAYAAANPQCSLLDLEYEWYMGNTILMSYLRGQSPADQDEFNRDTPLARAQLVKTPTLIFAGTEDFLPSIFSLEFHDHINAAGTIADYYEFIGEPHGLIRPTSQSVASQAQIEWFRTYLVE